MTYMKSLIKNTIAYLVIKKPSFSINDIDAIKLNKICVKKNKKWFDLKSTSFSSITPRRLWNQSHSINSFNSNISITPPEVVLISDEENTSKSNKTDKDNKIEEAEEDEEYESDNIDNVIYHRVLPEIKNRKSLGDSKRNSMNNRTSITSLASAVKASDSWFVNGKNKGRNSIEQSIQSKNAKVSSEGWFGKFNKKKEVKEDRGGLQMRDNFDSQPIKNSNGRRSANLYEDRGKLKVITRKYTKDDILNMKDGLLLKNKDRNEILDRKDRNDNKHLNDNKVRSNEIVPNIRNKAKVELIAEQDNLLILNQIDSTFQQQRKANLKSKPRTSLKIYGSDKIIKNKGLFVNDLESPTPKRNQTITQKGF